jgi:chromosomal replication initiator protein
MTIMDSSKTRLILIPHYTFNNFVVGPNNRLAYSSCVSVSRSLGKKHNPLYLYGDSGLGKTHLLHAIYHQCINEGNDLAIQLLSCEDFVNRFIRAIEEGDLSGFQRQFRTVDMLVIDDVQFLREREHSQEEFFHTFNALYNNGKQIILSADSPPGKIPSIETRLISRFKWGLVVRIDPPIYKTRIGIIKNKANLCKKDISDNVAKYLAKRIQNNVRELEGALTTITALADTENRDITVNLVYDFFSETLGVDNKKIKELRLSRGLTQKKLAQIISCSPSLISLIERGKKKAISRKNLNNLAKALDVSVSQLLGGEDEEEIEYDGSRISRYIEFSPEHYQAGISIISYFSTVLQQKHPDANATIRIEQKELAVRLIVDSPDGEQEIIERTLHDYGLVVTGRMSPSELLSNPQQVLQLENKLDIARAELRAELRLLDFERSAHKEQIDTLESQITWLRGHVGGLLQQADHNSLFASEMLALLKSHLAKIDDKVLNDAIGTIVHIIQAGLENSDQSNVTDALYKIKKHNRSLFNQIKDFSYRAASSTTGKLLYDLITHLPI